MKKRSVQVAAVIAAFIVVHAWLILLSTKLQQNGSTDINLYHVWVDQGVTQKVWQGLDTTWVYPQVALLPMRIVGLIPHQSAVMFQLVWCIFITILNAVACIVMVVSLGWEKARTGIVAWLVFLILLGQTSISHIDSTVVPLMVIGLVIAFKRPWVASFLLTVGAWIKIVPAAVVLAAFCAVRRGVRDILVPAAVTTLLVVAYFYVFSNSHGSLFGFLTNQTGRGLQVESIFATPLVLNNALHHTGIAVWNDSVGSYEVASGMGHAFGQIATVLLPVALVLIAILAFWAKRLGMEALLLTSFCLIDAMLIFNKVGSPQFSGWIFAACVVALAVGRNRKLWWRLSVISGVVALCTQILYPLMYLHFISGSLPIVFVVVVRNALVVAGFVYAVIKLGKVALVTEAPDTAPVIAEA